MRQPKCKRKNALLTSMIINLHAEGYTEEFSTEDTQTMLFPLSDPKACIPYFEILLINQVFDELSGSYKYIHANESDCGVRGLLLTDKCLFHLSAQE